MEMYVYPTHGVMRPGTHNVALAGFGYGATQTLGAMNAGPIVVPDQTQPPTIGVRNQDYRATYAGLGQMPSMIALAAAARATRAAALGGVADNTRAKLRRAIAVLQGRLDTEAALNRPAVVEALRAIINRLTTHANRADHIKAREELLAKMGPPAGTSGLGLTEVATPSADQEEQALTSAQAAADAAVAGNLSQAASLLDQADTLYGVATAQRASAAAAGDPTAGIEQGAEAQTRRMPWGWILGGAAVVGGLALLAGFFGRGRRRRAA